MRMPGEQQLDDDLRVEVEVVGVERERNALERRDRVDAIARVELAETASEQPVLERAQDLVADELVERHAARARAALARACASRTPHRPRRRASGRSRVGQAFGRVLPVAVEQGDEVEAVAGWRSDSRSSDCRRSPGSPG